MINRPEYDAKSIGRNLKRLREAKKLTVDEVRRYLGVGSVQAIYKYEAGKSYPPADAMFALMQLYEADLYDILCGRERRPSVTEMEAAREWRQRGRRRCINYYRGSIVRKAGVNPYEESMEGVLEQRSELGHIVVSDGDSTVKRNVV